MSAFSFAIAVLGCRSNQEEMDALRSQLLAMGGREVAYPGPADLVLVNTCAVTASAQAQSRQAVRRAARARCAGLLIATGCAAQAAPVELGSLPGVALVLGNRAKAALPEILAVLNEERPPAAGTAAEGRRILRAAGLEPARLPAAGAAIAWDPDPTLPGFLDRRGPIATTRSRPGLKIQDGCPLRCSFCIVSQLRGRPRSREAGDVLREAGRLAAAGYREIVLTGINLGLYGLEAIWPRRPSAAGDPLVKLLDELCEVPGIERIRLSSLEPMTMRPALLDAVAALPKVARHLHLAAQSGDDAVLRSMNRSYTARDLAELVDAVRSRMPLCAVGMDVLAGFPGEDEAAFARTLDLLAELEISYLHAFGYSERPGTAASELRPVVPAAERKARVRRLRALDASLRLDFQRRLTGRPCHLIIERVSGPRFEGVSGEFVRMAGEAPGIERGAWQAVVAGQAASPGLQACRLASAPAG